MRLREDELNRFGEELGRGLARPGHHRVLGRPGRREDDAGAGDLPRSGRRRRPRPARPTPWCTATRRPRGPSIHVDCYRLRSSKEARDLGLDDILAQKAVLLVEWPEKAGHMMPPLDRYFLLSHDADPQFRNLEER